MSMTTIRKLLTVIRDVGGAATLGNDVRQQIVAELENCLGSYERLEIYVSVLHEVMQGETRPSDEDWLEGLSDDVLGELTQRGLAAVDDTSLIRLALDPIALHALGLHLAESVFTDYWTKVRARAWRDSQARVCTT